MPFEGVIANFNLPVQRPCDGRGSKITGFIVPLPGPLEKIRDALKRRDTCFGPRALGRRHTLKLRRFIGRVGMISPFLVKGTDDLFGGNVGTVIDLKRTRMRQHRLSDCFVGAVAICAAESLQSGVLVEVVTLQLTCIHQIGIVASGAPVDVRSGAIFGHDKGGGRDAPAGNVERILGAAKTAAETVDLVEILDFGSQSESLVKDLLWTALIPPKHEALVDKAFRRIDIAAVRVSPDEVVRI